MAQNEMKDKPALPERVRSMEGLGVSVWNASLACIAGLQLLLGCQATKALRERERPDLRDADGEPLVLSEPLLRTATAEALRGAEVLPMRSSGPTD